MVEEHATDLESQAPLPSAAGDDWEKFPTGTTSEVANIYGGPAQVVEGGAGPIQL